MPQLAEGLWLYRCAEDDRHAVLRHHLAGLLACAPEAVAVACEPGGKPYLTAPTDRLSFSPSHRPGLLLVATAWDDAVGADIEVAPAAGTDDEKLALATQFFAPGEARWLASLAGTARGEGFLRLWTAKEAVLKGLGSGIGEGLAEPDLTPFLTAGQPLPVQALGVRAGGMAWTLTWAAPGDGVVAAMARQNLRQRRRPAGVCGSAAEVFPPAGRRRYHIPP